MSTYITITELEMDSLLKADKGWSKTCQKNGELVYEYRSLKNPDIVVKVYSSINKSGLSRKCGSDAIRVCAVNTRTNKGIIKNKRVYRVPGWDERIKQRVIETLNQIF